MTTLMCDGRTRIGHVKRPEVEYEQMVATCYPFPGCGYYVVVGPDYLMIEQGRDDCTDVHERHVEHSRREAEIKRVPILWEPT